MEKLLIINGSPRAPKSNSKRYGQMVLTHWRGRAFTMMVNKNNHNEIIEKTTKVDDILLMFPLYADGIPATMLSFLIALEKANVEQKPTIHVLVNCGFIEPAQNNVALEMVRLFCEQNGYPFGSSLKIGSGEAILDTPFSFLVNRKIKQQIFDQK